ncbi:phosphocholine-specific phospholipase C [Pseudobacter ginsenosidimutans]|uniref:phospholipase C n=1 Tax=Pseudobacter ginsenosidimutans TaxID=661488 RepID=A0A4Q7MMK6_9BACT|nr:phospholipase C, phosphocholine-specific [Pseudobacter ginsenosidimutans]QEC45784.1 phospholipase C, phosphocholine-specific [Pseudobacter ginsenosidimutans]RZS69267.1 phospholipase C [Pseudobacter ginsenosidimutans]
MDTRREFLKNAGLIAGGTGLLQFMPASIARALAIDPAPGSTYLDAEHIVFLMQENRSFDHAYGTLQGVRGFNDPRAIQLPNQNLVWLQTDKNGKTYCPFHLDIKDTKATWMSALPHSWSNQVDVRNDGMYDRWLHAKPSGRREYRDMPLTLGYHTREDLPFYYAMADAFTVCDHNFCSSLTGTTPNRLYFWSGTIREKADPNVIARVWNGDADYGNEVSWKTFPERLEENDISWRVYQNELSVYVGLQGEEESWLANFTDNSLEFFTQYNVWYHPPYIDSLPEAIKRTADSIQQLEQKIAAMPANSEDTTKTKRTLARQQRYLQQCEEHRGKYIKAGFDKLTPFEKNIHFKAFTTNSGDPDYHSLSDLTYQDGDTTRTMKAPKGDVLHQFRKDVEDGKLPTVSWLVAPENFSDHPGAAWFGVWYISEVLDILTKNPEVWKKTIFVLTYDENDGYFDHLPPFVAPHPAKKDSGKVSEGIDTAVEYVANKEQQSSDADDMRESPIGLGYRVPMVIASPWSRGGYVNSEVFDHTSSLQFLEHFLSHKTKKEIRETNITEWRRVVCGNLTSAFRPWKGEKIELPKFIERDPFIEGIHKAQFKKLPDNFKALTEEEINAINRDPFKAAYMARQEPGTRSACSLPYFMTTTAISDKDSNTLLLMLHTAHLGSRPYGGTPFTVYAWNLKNREVKCRSYAVKAGEAIKDTWNLDEFENGQYHLRVYGPNGFYREHKGSAKDPSLQIDMGYERSGKKHTPTGNINLTFENFATEKMELLITDNVYRSAPQTIILKPGKHIVTIDTQKNFHWYDLSITVINAPDFSLRLAGHAESEKPTKTDPFMGQVV